MKIKAFLLTIVVILSTISIFSCGEKDIDRDYNETEVITSAKDLIKKSALLNEIYYGHGIECDTSDVSNANGYYFPADILSLNKFGVQTLDDIKKLTRECFTEAQSNFMINTVLSSIRDDEGDITYFARYYQEYDSLNTSEEKCIMVYSKYEPFLIDTVEYLYDTVKISDVEGEIITVEIDVNVTNSKGSVQKKTLKINLLEEKDGFRIDSPTYARNSEIQE